MSCSLLVVLLDLGPGLVSKTKLYFGSHQPCCYTFTGRVLVLLRWVNKVGHYSQPSTAQYRDAKSHRPLVDDDVRWNMEVRTIRLSIGFVRHKNDEVGNRRGLGKAPNSGKRKQRIERSQQLQLRHEWCILVIIGQHASFGNASNQSIDAEACSAGIRRGMMPPWIPTVNLSMASSWNSRSMLPGDFNGIVSRTLMT